MPVTLCPQGDEARFQDWVVSLKARMGTIDHWIDTCHSPESCESAVTSPSASSVADSWSARSTSIATETSRAPFVYRVLPPVCEDGTLNLLSTLIGKRFWRFTPTDKATFLEVLDIVDPQHILSTPPSKCTAVHDWIADIPTPHTPSPVRPSRLRDLTPSPLSSSLFSSILGSPENLDAQAHGLPVVTPSPEPTPACQASPSSEASSDGWLFNRRRFFIRRASPAASPSPRPRASPVASPSPSPRTSSPVAHSFAPETSPLPAASPSPSPDNNKVTDALSNLQDLLAAGSPLPITRTSPPVTRSSPAAPASPVVTRSATPPRPLCRKRKLAADASPAPIRSRPGVTRFEPPTAFRFTPVLPDSLPSLPRPGTSMPGSFPTAIRVEPLAPATPSTPAPGFPWKTVAGVAVGAFALGCLASRYFF